MTVSTNLWITILGSRQLVKSLGNTNQVPLAFINNRLFYDDGSNLLVVDEVESETSTAGQEITVEVEEVNTKPEFSVATVESLTLDARAANSRFNGQLSVSTSQAINKTTLTLKLDFPDVSRWSQAWGFTTSTLPPVPLKVVVKRL